MILSSSLILIATTLTGVAPSTLVSDDHKHDWIVVSDEGDEPILIDRAFEQTHEHENAKYPKTLSRVLVGNSLDGPEYADVVFAIDCEQSMVAPTDAFFAHDDPEKNIRAPKMAVVEFQTISDWPASFRDPIFRHVCGPEWSYKPAQ